MKTYALYLILFATVLAACSPQVTPVIAPTTTVGGADTVTSETLGPSVTSGESGIALLRTNTTLAIGERNIFNLTTHCGVDFLWVNDQAWRPDVKDPSIDAWSRSVPDGWNVDLTDPATLISVSLLLIDESTLTATAGDPPLTITYRPDASVLTPPLCD